MQSVLFNGRRLSLLLMSILLVLASFATADEFYVQTTQALNQALNEAKDGDVLTLASAIYVGNFEIKSAITLVGEVSAVIDAQGIGNGILISSNRVNIKNIHIQNWGDDLTETNAGIKAIGVEDIQLTDNKLAGDGFGIYLQSVSGARIQGNTIEGNPKLRSSDRGNGIHLIDVTQSVVADNRIKFTRDGLYIINSQNNELRNNQMRQLRFGVHYMYSHENTVRDNLAEQVKVGYALMSSQQLSIINNIADDCEDYGLLLNFVNDSLFKKNKISNVKNDPEISVSGDSGKALFIYNSSNNTIFENTFAHSNLGIHLTAGSENNAIYSNNFINNELQVKYVSTRLQEWSRDKKGNYWSNYMGWDIDNDGIGDTAFEPNDGVDKLLWKYPEAKVLMDSPAVLLLRWVQRSFPVLKSPGVTDSYPSLTAIGELP